MHIIFIMALAVIAFAINIYMIYKDDENNDYGKK